MALKKTRKRKRTSQFRKTGTIPLRVTLWVTRQEKDRIREKAKSLMPLTARGLPRTGIYITEIIRDWWEREAER